ncbi:MAG: hypothetical protein LIO94_09285, partial [Clostridiales bacterium]|nr:hypothetical protein [Clostridiales bacterium]
MKERRYEAHLGFLRMLSIAGMVFMMLFAFCPQHTSAATKIDGIDVSKWQGTINWTKVKKAGIEFVMI